MEGGVVQFCLTSHLYIIEVEVLSRCHLVGNMSICVTRESIAHHIALNRGHESILESACQPLGTGVTLATSEASSVGESEPG